MKLSYETAQVARYVLIINGLMKRQLPTVMKSLTRITIGNLRQLWVILVYYYSILYNILHCYSSDVLNYI